MDTLVTWCWVWWLIAIFDGIRRFPSFLEEMEEQDPHPLNYPASVVAIIITVVLAPILMPACIICDAIFGHFYARTK